MNPNPKIVAFCCINCAYAAADLAGSMRIEYPPEVVVVAVPCTGAVEPAVILSAFEKGADGVIVAGCLEGECHYKSGNTVARHRVNALKSSLTRVGLTAARLEMFQVSAAMANRFGEVMNEFVSRIRQLPVSPIRSFNEDEVSTFDHC